MFPFQVPSQIQQPPEAALRLEEALAQVLDAYDALGPGGITRIPKVQGKDEPFLRWTLNCLQGERPENPFRQGSSAWHEAEAFRAFVSAPVTEWPGVLDRLPRSQEGTRMGLWRRGRDLERGGLFSNSIRIQWEDSLLESPLPGVSAAYALRHALSFCLASGDEARYSALKGRYADRDPELFLQFQKLFAMLGTPGPKRRIWSLPRLEPVDSSLQSFGTATLVIHPMPEQGFPALPAGCTWIIPTVSGSLGEGEVRLDAATLKEAEEIQKRLRSSERLAWLAPSAAEFIQQGFSFFPVQIDLDAAGLVARIRIGEAASPSR